MTKQIVSLGTLLLLLLSVCAWAEFTALDSAVTGSWVSSSGAQIQIEGARADTTTAVEFRINGGELIWADLVEDQHNTIKITYKLPSGTVMEGHYFGGEDVIRILDNGRLYSTWRRR